MPEAQAAQKRMPRPSLYVPGAHAAQLPLASMPTPGSPPHFQEATDQVAQQIERG